MNSRQYILKQTAVVAVGHAIGSGIICGAFALLGYFDRSVLLGSVVGSVIAIINFFLMSMGVMMAADKASAQDVKGGKATIRFSFTGRLVFMAAALIIFAKSGLCNVLSLVLPLVLTRPILTFTEFFGKSGDSTK